MPSKNPEQSNKNTSQSADAAPDPEQENFVGLGLSPEDKANLGNVIFTLATKRTEQK